MTKKELTEAIIRRAIFNLKQRDENLKLAAEEEEYRHHKQSNLYQSYANDYQAAFVEDANLYSLLKGLEWCDAIKELHNLAKKA